MPYNAIPARYYVPKWQAYVTPSEKAFNFSNGVRVRSLWELKQALLSVPEDVLQHHFNKEGNDIATWVEHVVGDVELARELASQQHRWGLVVALERQLMRTLKLPDYVAERWLGKSEFPFTFVTGEKVESLEELRDGLKQVNDEAIAFHREREPNDISAWVAEVIGDYELAELLEEATGRWQMQRYVEDEIVMLQEAR